MRARLTLCAALLASTALWLASSPFARAGQVPKVQTLDNGLKVVLLEDHASPLVAATVWIHVGGKDETDQVAGFSHFLEHLIPQGTKNRIPRQQQLEIFQAGGIASIQADHDRTFFFFLVPKEAQDRALEGLFQQVSEADLSDAAVERIRPSLTRELKEAYDDPTQVLFLEQMRAAFPGEPYRVPFYGSFQSLSNLEHTTADAFYGNFYVANNMVVAVGGDIDPGRTLDKIRGLFGTLKPSKALPPKPKFEPGFKGPRQVVKNLGNLPPSVSLIFPTPGYRHPDRFPLAVLARLLERSGAAPLLREAGASGRLTASTGFHLLEERGLLTFTCFATSQRAVMGAAEAMAGVLEKIRKEGFPEAEVRRIVRAMRLESTLRRSTVGALTQELAEATLFGDVRQAWSAEASLEKVTAADVTRVATATFVGDNAATLIVLPADEQKPDPEALGRLAERVSSLGPGKGKATPPDFAASVTASEKSSLPPRMARKPPAAASRTTLPNRLTVVLKPTPGSGISAVSLQVRAGFAFDPAGRDGLAQMVATFLPLGSESLSAQEFRERAAALGSAYGVSLSVETAEVGLTVFPEDLTAALDLVAASVRAPAFQEAELDAVRERLGRYREKLAQSPGETARELVRQKIYRNHPYARPSPGPQAALRSLTRDDLVAFHRTYYRPDRAVLSVVGDFNRAEVLSRIGSAFGAWTAPPGEKAPLELPELGSPDPLAGEYSRIVEAFPSELILAFPGVSLKDPQFPVLRALGTILSARGLLDLVLDQPLAISIRAGLDGLSRGGIMTVEASAPRSEISRITYELMLRARALGLKEVSPETLRNVRAVERGRLLREKEMLYSQASNLGFYELVGPGFGIYDEGKTLPAELTPAALREAAALYLDASRLVRVTAGPAPR